MVSRSNLKTFFNYATDYINIFKINFFILELFLKYFFPALHQRIDSWTINFTIFAGTRYTGIEKMKIKKKKNKTKNRYKKESSK